MRGGYQPKLPDGDTVLVFSTTTATNCSWEAFQAPRGNVWRMVLDIARLDPQVKVGKSDSMLSVAEAKVVKSHRRHRARPVVAEELSMLPQNNPGVDVCLQNGSLISGIANLQPL